MMDRHSRDLASWIPGNLGSHVDHGPRFHGSLLTSGPGIMGRLDRLWTGRMGTMLSAWAWLPGVSCTLMVGVTMGLVVLRIWEMAR